nr:ABC transporter C family member 8 [Tanacetum cinerariifolium]
ISNCEEYDENGDAILRPAESSKTIIEASTDLSVVDFDILFSFTFAVTSAIESVTIIIVMAKSSFTGVVDFKSRSTSKPDTIYCCLFSGFTSKGLYSYSLANYVILVERIKQYMHITPEPPAVVEKNRPPSSWSSKGRIELKDVIKVS